jgi:CheY-like chemotaxis protein
MQTVLVVEDDKNTNQVITEFLINAGFNTLPVYDGEEAIAAFYENKTFYKVSLPPSSAVFMRVFGNENRANVINAFEKLRSDPLFEYRYRFPNPIEFSDFDNPDFGEDNFPRFKSEFLHGYEQGRTEFALSDNFLSLKGLSADRLFINEPNVSIAYGRWFTEEEFFVHSPDDIILPVILGAGYTDLYETGDVIEYAQVGAVAPSTLHVIGFLEAGSWFYDNNNERVLLDRYMVIPAPTITYDFILPDGSYCQFARFAYSSAIMMNARIVVDELNAAAAMQRVYQIWGENKLYEFELFDETGGAQRWLVMAREQTLSNLIISVFTLLVCVLMFSIQANYKLNKYKKKYGIYMMSGITTKQLLIIMLQDIVLMFILSLGLLFALTEIYRKIWLGNPAMFHRFDIAPVSTETIVVLLVTQLLLLCFMGISGHIKIHKSNMSAALREHE